MDRPANSFDPARCYLYLRKSRDEEKDPHILDNHRILLLRTMAADGISIPADNMFEEIGTAELIESRPVFRRLMHLWERLPYQAGGMVTVVEMSRLSRGSLSQQGRVQDTLTRADIRIRTPERYYDLSVFEDRIAFNCLGLISNAEQELFKLRVRRAWDEMLRRGLIRNGQAPWGYLWSKDEENLLPEPLRFPLLCRACREVLTRSVKSLARDYGVPETNLLSALRNPTICGWPAVRHGPTGELDRHGRRDYTRLPRADWRWPEQVNDRYPHACTRSEWEAIQETLDRRRTGRSKLTGAGWCRDIVRFAAFPAPARCGSYAVPGRYRLLYEVLPPGRPKLYIERGIVHAAAESALAHLFEQPAAIRTALAAYEREEGRTAEHALSLEELLNERDRHERHLLQLLERELDADSPAALRRIATLRAEKEAAVERLTRQIEEIQNLTLPGAAGFAILRAVPLDSDPFPEWWAEMEEAERRLVARAFFASIEVTIRPDHPAHHREVTAVHLRPEWLAWLDKLHG